MAKYMYPVRDRILVERLEESDNEQTAAGLFLPGTQKDKLARGRVVGVGGGGALANSEPPPVSLGDVVWYPENIGVEVKVEGRRLRVMQYDHVFLYETSGFGAGSGFPLDEDEPKPPISDDVPF